MTAEIRRCTDCGKRVRRTAYPSKRTLCRTCRARIAAGHVSPREVDTVARRQARDAREITPHVVEGRYHAPEGTSGGLTGEERVRVAPSTEPQGSTRLW